VTFLNSEVFSFAIGYAMRKSGRFSGKQDAFSTCRMLPKIWMHVTGNTVQN
jgi:hypothetical protein